MTELLKTDEARQLNKLMADFAANRVENRVHSGFDDGHAPTGEPFVAFCLGGIKRDGQEIRSWASTPDLAASYWMEQFSNYVDNLVLLSEPTLYWRSYPQIAERKLLEHDTFRYPPTPLGIAPPLVEVSLYTVYSRLLVSRPLVKPDVDTRQVLAGEKLTPDFRTYERINQLPPVSHSFKSLRPAYADKLFAAMASGDVGHKPMPPTTKPVKELNGPVTHQHWSDAPKPPVKSDKP